MGKFKEILKKSHWFAAICAGVCLICSAAGAVVNTSGFSVKVSKVTVNMDEFYDNHPECESLMMSRKLGLDATGQPSFDVDAKLTGNIYLPKGVDANSPAPCVILTHGYLNSKEFEEAPAIEMSRRGYVVFAFDQYDHGESTWDTSITGSFSFFMWSIYDAVQYMYSQPYVLKAADKTGMISVSGHSMGGFSSEMGTAMDGMNAMMGLTQKICACLAVGADFLYVGGASMAALFGTRTCGAIAGIYDEFFFDQASEGTGETVREKHYTKDPQGVAFLGREGGESGIWYTNVGERIIYEVQGDHPYNTWSPEATACMIEFYTHAFQTQAKLHGADLSKTVHGAKGQTWWLKEVFTTIGLIALVGMMIGLALTLVKLPFFKESKTPDTEIKAVKKVGLARRIVGIAVSVASTVLAIFYIPAFMDMNANLGQISTLTNVVMIVGAVLALFSAAFKCITHKKEKKEGFLYELTENGIFGGFALAVVAFTLKWFVNDGQNLFMQGKWFTADSVTTIVYWAVGAGLLALIFTLFAHFFVKPGRDHSNLGLKANVKQIGVSLATGLVVVTAAWLVLKLCDTVFGVDFRSYIYSFRPATVQSFTAALRYMPLFFIFYICCGVNIANATEGLDGIRADLHAVGIEVTPVIIFMIIEYATQQIGGVGYWPTFALNVIVVQNLVWTLIFLAVIQRRTLKATNNIWTGVFINTIWFTMITLATTCIYLF